MKRGEGRNKKMIYKTLDFGFLSVKGRLNKRKFPELGKV